MSKIRRLFTAAAIALCAVLPSVAMAQNVLVLATDTANEGTSDRARCFECKARLATDTANEGTSDQYWASIKNIITAFRNGGATVTPSHTDVEDAARAAKVLTSGQHPSRYWHL